MLSATDLDVADEIDDLAEARLVQGRAGVVLGEDNLEGIVVALNGGHSLIDGAADFRLRGQCLEPGPSGLLRH